MNWFGKKGTWISDLRFLFSIRNQRESQVYLFLSSSVCLISWQNHPQLRVNVWHDIRTRHGQSYSCVCHITSFSHPTSQSFSPSKYFYLLFCLYFSLSLSSPSHSSLLICPSWDKAFELLTLLLLTNTRQSIMQWWWSCRQCVYILRMEHSAQQYSRTSSSIITHFPFQTCVHLMRSEWEEEEEKRRRRMRGEDGMRCASHKLAGPVHLCSSDWISVSPSSSSLLYPLLRFAFLLVLLLINSSCCTKEPKDITNCCPQGEVDWEGERRISIFIRCVSSRRLGGGGGGSGITSQLSNIHTNIHTIRCRCMLCWCYSTAQHNQRQAHLIVFWTEYSTFPTFVASLLLVFFLKSFFAHLSTFR